MTGAFDFNALAKATPGYVGADPSAFTGAAGIIAVKCIFKTLSDSPGVIPDTSVSTVDTDALMQIDASQITINTCCHLQPSYAFTEPSSWTFPQLPASSLSHSSIAHFLHSHPGPLIPV